MASATSRACCYSDYRLGCIGEACRFRVPAPMLQHRGERGNGANEVLSAEMSRSCRILNSRDYTPFRFKDAINTPDAGIILLRFKDLFSLSLSLSLSLLLEFICQITRN